MKINLSEKREDNKSNTFTSAQEGQPDFINKLFDIDGVKSIFYVMDFISVDKEDMQIGIIFFLKFNLLLNKYLQGHALMEILRVEPTPSPNTMKIVLSNKREDNKSNTFTYIEEQQPQFINDLLAIDGVKSIFYVMDS